MIQDTFNKLSVVVSRDSLCFNIQKPQAPPSRPQIMDLANGLNLDDFEKKLQNLEIDLTETNLRVGLMNTEVLLDNLSNDVEDSYKKFSSLNPTWQGHFMKHEEYADLELRSVFAIDDMLKNRFEKSFHSVSFYHLLPLVLRDVIDQNQHTKDHIRVHVNGHEIAILSFMDSKLTFYHIYQFSFPEDFLYYIKLTCDKNDIDINEVSVMLSGRIQNDGRIFNLLKKYIGKITFAGQEESYIFTDLRLLSECE